MLHSMKIVMMVLMLVLAVSAQAAEKVYKSVGPNGEVTFSDTPSRGSKAIEVQPTPTYVPAPLPALTPAPATVPKNVKLGYQTLRITAPPPEQTIISTAGNFSVQAQLAPALMAGDQVQFLLDSKPVSTGTRLSAALHNVNRGAHTLRVQVLNAGGNVVIQSDPVTVFLQRPSIHLPGHKAKHPSP